MEGITKFLKEVRAELRKVNWPTRRETSIFTGVVIFVVAAIGVIFAALDWVFSSALTALLG